MSDSDQTYDAARARNLEALLVALADRIHALHGEGTLLRHAGELMRLLGDVRSELFHYEVRATYDTPEVAESRRVVRDAIDAQSGPTWQPSEWTPDTPEDRE
ncbi:MAG TPA: hypothetical protein VGD56_05020 [Gemmatirosa sp.]